MDMFELGVTELDDLLVIEDANYDAVQCMHDYYSKKPDTGNVVSWSD